MTPPTFSITKPKRQKLDAFIRDPNYRSIGKNDAAYGEISKALDTSRNGTKGYKEKNNLPSSRSAARDPGLIEKQKEIKLKWCLDKVKLDCWAAEIGCLVRRVQIHGKIDQDKYIDCLAQYFLPWYEELSRDNNKQILFQEGWCTMPHGRLCHMSTSNECGRALSNNPQDMVGDTTLSSGNFGSQHAR
ncbi:hypothetical protein PHYBLDRAFT_141631 [Phycomyces blakesleeanus NRRL 1555(-)]|uniref:Homeodomain-like DNA binding domain-containing transcription factor n=1 Tax=Phycomyces blakesleeanus (strain ATCC 8743b / DSM 1359 / FGSC 10004 / NBRC 33097 / NRRL 1555) TaxID=763407 RepID=A0A167PEP3_PHYB8|nr:hypothetical protein PHYBLDRAFT_141631 [Phycomyces blakesleeanus NRRL 1555(-)]OAD77769.1 hypothetical protein PHYBLDRAFT_141631 [Phycomyces blakesleeanus NRRL 1555(-)]|eukprot:XP_018295809.1 hypothetical protein PHYBLDRAFT_141631 [Phycomyces blakesleeanus NRRL 1555(-)]